METSFFSGSENLYKYLVSIGILLTVMTVYYPLKEKQELEILSIKVQRDLEVIQYMANKNAKNVKNLEKSLNEDGPSPEYDKLLAQLDKLNQQDAINQIEANKKVTEIRTRSSYITIYNLIFWIFFPLGIAVTIYGFIKWKIAKKFDDNILKLENEKLGFQVEELRKAANNS